MLAWRLMNLIKSVADSLRGLLARMVRAARKPGGINDEAMPSGYLAPYKKGSRQVRNLWHIDF